MNHSSKQQQSPPKAQNQIADQIANQIANQTAKPPQPHTPPYQNSPTSTTNKNNSVKMLSLPLIAPQNEYILFLSPHLHPATDTSPHLPQHQRRPPSSSSHQNGNGLSNNNTKHAQASRHSLPQLVFDETSIQTRKHNIRLFGAGWIKPPGVAKTLQAEMEDRAEREEQEGIARRERALADMQAVQEIEEARGRGEEAAQAEAEGGERDLDEEIPDAEEGEEEEEEEESGVSEEGDLDLDLDDDVEAVDEEADITFNEESLLENSFLPTSASDEEERERIQQERYARLEEAELTGVAQDEADLGIERDLDDSVPEAGSYEHTDSELVSSSEEEASGSDDNEAEQISEVRPRSATARRSSGRASFGRRSSGRRSLQSAQSRRSLRGGQALVSESERSLRSRDVDASINRDISFLLGSSLIESSFMASSPVMGRLRSGNDRGGGAR
ncbi:hypothetical protein BDV97DRAFT_367014 [Delphinella strobiligena]|nr:hypothetical protein BDV97DRAFT_367014 [Delphinella strobiligena]